MNKTYVNDNIFKMNTSCSTFEPLTGVDQFYEFECPVVDDNESPFDE